MSVVTEESENIYGQRSKSAVYNEAKAEKEVRSTLKSAVLRVLSKDGVVILDSLNYIKGTIIWTVIGIAPNLLDASTRLYQRLFPSVGLSVRRSSNIAGIEI